MGNPIEIKITVTDASYRRRVEKQIRGLLILTQYESYVDTVNLPDDVIEITVDVTAPDEAQQIKQKLQDVEHVKQVH